MPSYTNPHLRTTELETQLALNQRHCEHLFQRNEVQVFMNKVKTHYRKERGKTTEVRNREHNIQTRQVQREHKNYTTQNWCSSTKNKTTMSQQRGRDRGIYTQDTGETTEANEGRSTGHRWGWWKWLLWQRQTVIFTLVLLRFFFACKGEHKSDFFVVEYFQLESLKCLKKK